MTDTGKKTKAHLRPPKNPSTTSEVTVDTDIGAMIKAHRKARNWTLVHLAELTGIDNGNLSKLERGKQSLTNDSMRLLADVFGITLSELFENIDRSTNSEPSIMAAQNRTGAGIKRWRPVKSFKKLRDIPLGENVLIDGVKVVAHAGQGKKGWSVDEEHQYAFPGDPLRELNSNPADLVVHFIADDTMTPRLFQHDSVVIDIGNATVPSTGGVFAITSENQPIEIRRLFPKAGNGLMIVCDNDAYPTMNLTADEREFIHIIGRVKAMCGTAGF